MGNKQTIAQMELEIHERFQVLQNEATQIVLTIVIGNEAEINKYHRVTIEKIKTAYGLSQERDIGKLLRINKEFFPSIIQRLNTLQLNSAHRRHLIIHRNRSVEEINKVSSLIKKILLIYEDKTDQLNVLQDQLNVLQDENIKLNLMVAQQAMITAPNQSTNPYITASNNMQVYYADPHGYASNILANPYGYTQ